MIKPPKYVSFQRGHPLARDIHTVMPFNDNYGDHAWDHVRRDFYDFDTTDTPSWSMEGVEFVASREHLEWIPQNELSNAMTILFHYRQTSAPSSYYYWVCN